MERSASEEIDEDAAEAESKSDEMHEPDTALVFPIAHDFRVEEQQRMFDGPVAGEVEEIGRESELRILLEEIAHTGLRDRMGRGGLL